MARPWRSDGASRVKLADVDIKCTAFNADGSVLGIGLESGEVQLCAWPSLQVTATLGKHSDAVTAGPHRTRALPLKLVLAVPPMVLRLS